MENTPPNGWDLHAETYARLAAPCTGYFAQSLFWSAAGRLPPGPRILEVACGNGELSRAAVLHCLAERNPTEPKGRVVATDFSAAMVALTSNSLSVLGGNDLVHCEVQDGQALTFESNSFDAVFSAFGIFLFPDRQAGWGEAARVLRPGGLLATAVWRGPEHNGLARIQMGPVLAALPEHIRETLPAPSWLAIATEEGLRGELTGAGFADIEVSVFDAVLTMPTARAAWESICENPLTQSVLARCTSEELAAVAASVLANFEELAGGPDRPLHFDASCHFALARRV